MIAVQLQNGEVPEPLGPLLTDWTRRIAIIKDILAGKESPGAASPADGNPNLTPTAADTLDIPAPAGIGINPGNDDT